MTTNNDFRFFFSKIEYFLSLGKGFTVYHAPMQCMAEFLNCCKAHNVPYKILRLSEAVLEKFVIPDPTTVTVIYQDLDLDTYQKKCSSIADKIVFPLWYNHRSICFFSELPESEYAKKTIKSSDIHTDYQKVINFLLREQIDSLLSRVNVRFSSPEFMNLSSDKTVFTPIEQMMARGFEAAGMEYLPQVHLGRYFVDFLVTAGSKKVIVECDGREFHDPERDAERDKELSLEGYPILRFSGSDIYQDVHKCVERIQEAGRSVIRPSIKIDVDLDEDQLKAVHFISGPIRVLAPAGSGKTKTLTNRIVHLINQGVPEGRILALAFNKKASEEMQARLAAMQIQNVEVRTFHSFGMEIIRKYLKWNFQGQSENKTTRELLRLAVTEHVQLPARRGKDPLDGFLDALRKAKMELLPLDSITVEFEEKIYPFEEIFLSYIQKQTNKNFFNFDDMIYLAVRILLDNDEVRRSYQNQFEYLLVDEFQDLNKAQLLLLQILALPENNIFVVGDDDQMIYGWRGAEVRHIVDFNKRYSVFNDCVLSTNYRSSSAIVRHSRWLIDHNKDRVAKNIHAKPSALHGAFEMQCAENIWEEAQKAASWILKLQAGKKQDWKAYAVLYRYNALEFPIALALDSCQIPHTPVNSQRLFQTRVGRDVYSYLTVLLYWKDATPEDYGRILRTPNKYLRNELIAKVDDWDSFTTLFRSPDLKSWEIEKLVNCVRQIQYLQAYAIQYNNQPADVLTALANEVGLREAYKDQSHYTDNLDEASDELLLEIILAVARSYKDIRSFYQAMHKALMDESQDGEIKSEDNPHLVHLSTIHRAKGKEFANVVYFGLSQNGKPMSDTDMEEERRVCYVGATRPKNCLLVTFNTSRPSGFVKELALNPGYASMNLLALRGKKSTLDLQFGKSQHDYDKLDREKLSIVDKFPELSGKSSDISTTVGFLYRFRAWYREKQLQKALKRVALIEQQMNEITQKQIAPVREEVLSLEEEINFRVLLKLA